MSEALNTLREQLRHPDNNLRSQAALRLGKLDDADALKLLIDALRTEPSLYVREDITWAIVRKGDAAVLPLIDLLRDPSPAARHHAAHVLSKIGDSRTVEALIEALHDSDDTVVLKVVFALGQIGDSRAIPALMDVLGHENADVQSTLVTVLENFGSAAVNSLIQALIHQRWQVREQAADILGLIGSRDAVPALVEALQDAHWQVRFAAVTALGQLGGVSAKNAVLAMHDDPDQRVRSLTPRVVRRMRA